MPVKSNILVEEQKDLGFLNNFPGHTCTPKMSKFYDLRVLKTFMIWLVSPEITRWLKIFTNSKRTYKIFCNE